MSKDNVVRLKCDRCKVSIIQDAFGPMSVLPEGWEYLLVGDSEHVYHLCPECNKTFNSFMEVAE